MSTTQDSDSDIFEAVRNAGEPEESVSTPNNEHDPSVGDIYPGKQTFRVSDPKKTLYSDFNNIERTYSQSSVPTIPHEVVVGGRQDGGVDLSEDISVESAGVTGTRDDRRRSDNPLYRQQQEHQNGSPSKKPPTHPNAHSPSPNTEARVRFSPSPMPGAHSTATQSHVHSRSQSPPGNQSPQPPVQPHYLYQYPSRQSPSPSQDESPSRRVSIRPINPDSHLLSTTAAREISHVQAEELLTTLHQPHIAHYGAQASPLAPHSALHRSPHGGASTGTRARAVTPPSRDLMRETAAFMASTDFRKELERRQEKRDIWWSERKPTEKAPVDPAVKSRLYQPTKAYTESVFRKDMDDKFGNPAPRPLSPGRRFAQIPEDSQLLRSTLAAKNQYKTTPPPPKPQNTRLHLEGQQTFNGTVMSKLMYETMASKLAKRNKKGADGEDTMPSPRKTPPTTPGAAGASPSPVKAPSERLLAFNTAMQRQARAKAEPPTAHADPRELGWNSLFTRDKIDEEPFKEKYPTDQSLVTGSSRATTPRRVSGGGDSISPNSSVRSSTGSATKNSGQKGKARGTNVPPSPPLSARSQNTRTASSSLRSSSPTSRTNTTPRASSGSSGFGSSSSTNRFSSSSASAGTWSPPKPPASKILSGKKPSQPQLLPPATPKEENDHGEGSGSGGVEEVTETMETKVSFTSF